MNKIIPFFLLIFNAVFKYSVEFYMTVLVNEKGEPELVKIDSSPCNEITKMMQQALILVKYKLAFCDGILCKMAFAFKVYFAQKLPCKN